MSSHSGLDAIKSGAQKFGSGVVDAAHGAQNGTNAAMHSIAQVLHTIQHLGLDDVLKPIGLSRRRGFPFGALFGGIAIGACAVAIATIAIPGAPKARRMVRQFVKSAVGKGKEVKDEVEDRVQQNGVMKDAHV
jgi:hypothetical protein